VSAYLDHAASTPMLPIAIEAMTAAASQHFGNPSGAHRLARDARRLIDDARQTVADALGADLGEVVFTSGGTEADNLAVLGMAEAGGGVAMCSAVEHHAVLDPVVRSGGVLVPVGAEGTVDRSALAGLVKKHHPAVVSLMLANNEVGSVTDLHSACAAIRTRSPDTVVHTDAVQAMPWLAVDELASAADLVAISAHKFGGPKGVGALAVRKAAATIRARAIGGGQERERRGGTQNVLGIVSMAAALAHNRAEREHTNHRVMGLRDRLEGELLAAIPGACSTLPLDAIRLPNIVHLCLPGVEVEALLVLLEQEEVYASAGSSCSSGAMEPSHVLAAMGIDRELAFASVRLSLGWCSTDEEIDLALRVIPHAVARLRNHRERDVG